MPHLDPQPAVAAPPAPRPVPRWSPASAALLLLALILPAVVYAPITGGFFRTDDFLHLYRIANEGVAAFVLTMHGGHLLMTRNAVFALSAALFGPEPARFFWVVLLTHLLNVALLFRVVHVATGSARLACFGAALWGTLPVQRGTLEWYSVYGHALVATGTLAVLLALVHAGRGRPPRTLAPLGWALLLLAAATSFGVGIGIAGAMPVAAWLLLPAGPRRRRVVAGLGALALAIALAYVPLQQLSIARHGGIPSYAYLRMDPSLWWMPLRMLLDLLAAGMAAVAGGVAGGRLATGWNLAAAAGLLAGLLAALVRGGRSTRRTILAGLLLAAAGYAVIAAGRAPFLHEQQQAAWGAQVPRFHYAATALLVVAGCTALAALRPRWLRGRVATALLLVWAGASLAAHLTGAPRRDAAAERARRETGQVLAALHEAARTVPSGQDVYIENRPFRSIGPLYAPQGEQFPGWAAVFVIYVPGEAIDGRRVRFVEPDPLVIAATRDGRRTAGLLVAPDAVRGPIYRPAAPGSAPPR